MNACHLIVTVLLIGSMTTTVIFAQSDPQIPPWVKSSALFWGQGDIDDSEFINLIQFLINREIITVPNGDSQQIKELENEIAKLKGSIANDVQSAYDDGYYAGLSEKDEKSITVFTNRQVYSDGDILRITGNADKVKSGTVITIIITSPLDNVVSLGQVTTGDDKKFSSEFEIGGVLFEEEGAGTYTVTVGYGTEHISAPTTFVYDGVLANDEQVVVEPAMGSLVPGCEETPEGCFIPSVAIVDVGEKVIFSNTDSGAHTFTSGYESDSVGVVFDTLSNKSFLTSF